MEVRPPAALNPSAVPITVEPSPSPTASAADRERSAADDARETSDTPALDFRHTEIHFGKNRGLTLAELTPQQIHWYETEWMPKKETEGLGGERDKALVAGPESLPCLAGCGKGDDRGAFDEKSVTMATDAAPTV